jgi:hypothetical protein
MTTNPLYSLGSETVWSQYYQLSFLSLLFYLYICSFLSLSLFFHPSRPSVFLCLCDWLIPPVLCLSKRLLQQQVRLPAPVAHTLGTAGGDERCGRLNPRGTHSVGPRASTEAVAQGKIPVNLIHESPRCPPPPPRQKRLKSTLSHEPVLL